jgi:hypothetical protein
MDFAKKKKFTKKNISFLPRENSLANEKYRFCQEKKKIAKKKYKFFQKKKV